jgi:hypothetical protein
MGGCGKKGPPLPPLRILPRPAQKVHIRQTGGDVLIEATVALSRTDDSPLGPGSGVQILRMRPGPGLKATAVSARYLMSAFLKEAKVVATVDWDQLKTAVVAGHVLYHDRSALPAPAEGQANLPPRYMYAVQIVDERGQKSAPSVPLEIQLEPPPAAPLRLKVEPAEGEVRLGWESGESAAKGELYNVYRRPASQKEEPLVPVNLAPITERTYLDLKFDYGETYRYSVRSLRQPPPPLRESAPCDEVEVRPLDVYPPKAPTGLAAAVEGQSIKLYWFPNSEPDLGGYRVYRRVAKGELQRIGEVDAAETSYADTTVTRGVRYYYSVSAVDKATPPNESARSEEVSESMTADTASPPGGAGR